MELVLIMIRVETIAHLALNYNHSTVCNTDSNLNVNTGEK